MKSEWKYTKTDGRPKEMNRYYCVLVSLVEREEGERIPHIKYDTRFYADLDKLSDRESFVTMKGEPDSGLAWVEDAGSIEGERVYAWHELPEQLVIDNEMLSFARGDVDE